MQKGMEVFIVETSSTYIRSTTKDKSPLKARQVDLDGLGLSQNANGDPVLSDTEDGVAIGGKVDPVLRLYANSFQPYALVLELTKGCTV